MESAWISTRKTGFLTALAIQCQTRVGVFFKPVKDRPGDESNPSEAGCTKKKGDPQKSATIASAQREEQFPAEKNRMRSHCRQQLKKTNAGAQVRLGEAIRSEPIHNTLTGLGKAGRMGRALREKLVDFKRKARATLPISEETSTAHVRPVKVPRFLSCAPDSVGSGAIRVA